MIHRNRPPPAPSLVAAATEELTDIKAYYDPKNIEKLRQAGRPNSDPASYRFQAYLVAKADLEQLFGKKCGYCETKYKAAVTGDIEHYRPKGKIRTSQRKTLWPGYYWLAADWTNLLPVCKRCNSKGRDLDLGDGTERVTGKGEWFPLSDENRRAHSGTDPKDEDPLLLDPCRDEPDQHLVFFESGEHRALLKGITQKGCTTVEILGLNRTDLVERRMELLVRLNGLMVDIQGAQRRAARATTELDLREALAEIVRKKEELEGFMADDREYTALSRHVVVPFLDAMKKIATGK